MILPNHPKTLIELADTAAPTLPPWFANLTHSQQFQYPVLGNILIIDHFESSNITEIVLQGLDLGSN